ncbi:hypothetical protein Bealeia1_00730 [Candidatus Bealeia paramacronuclearis]|uniref:Lipoprotein n=1 Tax=Candidatus Bealeia paramacronuclearis TaxID=1921001 RepID=A0ABZ2C319_9PROT|nr:hypothetical protein [Candidatus Bealeia paramacronuclearis]
MLRNFKILSSIFLISITAFSERAQAGICCSKGSHADEGEKKSLVQSSTVQKYDQFVNESLQEEEKKDVKKDVFSVQTEKENSTSKKKKNEPFLNSDVRRDVLSINSEETSKVFLKTRDESQLSILERGNELIQKVEKSLPLTKVEQTEKKISIRAPIIFLNFIVGSEELVKNTEAYKLWGDTKATIDFKLLKKNLPTKLKGDIESLNSNFDENSALNTLLVDILQICEEMDKDNLPDARIARNSTDHKSKILLIPNADSPLGYIFIKIDGVKLTAEEKK